MQAICTGLRGCAAATRTHNHRGSASNNTRGCNNVGPMNTSRRNVLASAYIVVSILFSIIPM